jgi:anti-anti-sigma factor
LDPVAPWLDTNPARAAYRLREDAQLAFNTMTAPHPEGSAVKATPFTVHVDRASDGIVRVHAVGELDLATVPELKGVLRTELTSGENVTLDLSALEFIDSSGLQAILAALKEAASLPGALTISSSIPPQVHRLLEIAGVLDALPFVDG